MATFGLRRPSEGEGGGLARGFGPSQPGPARPGKEPRHAVVETTRRRGLCQRDGAHCRPGSASGRARRVRKEVTNPSMQHNGMEKERRKHFHGEANHGDAMTDGGEHAQAAIPCSKGVTAMSTRCGGARRSEVRLIAGSGGASTANFAGGAAVAMAAREQGSVRAKQRGSTGE